MGGGVIIFKVTCINTHFKDYRRFLVFPTNPEYTLKNAFQDFMNPLTLSTSVERQVGKGQKAEGLRMQSTELQPRMPLRVGGPVLQEEAVICGEPGVF